MDPKTILGGPIDDILPFQMLTLEEKTEDWVKAVADFYETAGWSNVEKKAARIQRNFWMRHGKLNPSDYIVGATDIARELGFALPQATQSPLEQFYPLAPNFVDVLRGEFIKRDNSWTVEAIDPYSTAEAFKFKKEQFEGVLTQMATMEKAQTLASMGITPETDPQQYMQQMQEMQQRLTEIEFQSKNFRTTGQKWAEKVLKIHEKRYNLQELEPDGFESGLISDSEFWHLDLMDDDFRVELLNPKWCDYHKGPNVKYVSDGDYFLWFDFMSAGDIVNKFGRRMKEADILKLKDVYVRTANLMVVDHMKAEQGAYYDFRKSFREATDLNPVMNDVLLGKELAYNYMRTPNFDHNIDNVDILNPVWGRRVTGHPQMFRVMRLYWRSLRRIGWLTKINRDGTRIQPEWVDESYKVTVEPQYDVSVNKEKTKDNLLYGEHIDWTWVPEWRQVIKISPNQQHTFWLGNENTYEAVYIDGGPVKFQFKGRNNPFDSLPPVEGCSYSYLNTEPHSFIDRLRPMQIIYNICMNKVPKKFLKDYGNKVAIDRRIMSGVNGSNLADVDPIEAYDEKLRESDILDYTLSRDAMEGMGNPALPQVLALSTVQEAQLYLQLGQMIRWEAGELIGISRERLGSMKASSTATGITQGITYSETQTEKYYEQHANLMQRVRQRMLDATQFYTTFQESSQAVYMNDREENVFLQIEAMDNLLPHYNIYLQSKANVRAALNTISNFLQNENTLPIKPSAKLEAMVEGSLSKVLNLVKQSEFEQERMQREQQMLEQQQAQQDQQLQLELQQREQAFEAEQNDLNRQRDIDVAQIRALGGLQSDNNANGTLDAQENLDNVFRQQELMDQRKFKQDELNQRRQENVDKNALEMQKSQLDLAKEKMKGEYALKIAKENKTAAELKKKQNKSKPK